MADTDIEWADKSWNFLVGCSRETVDPALPSGCDNCYAIGEISRERCEQHKGLTVLRPETHRRPGYDWNGKVNFPLHKLEEPLHWRKPQRIFVNSVSDLFHHRVPFETIAAAFGVMAACPQHTFLTLTKRHKRMPEFFEWLEAETHGTARPQLVIWAAARKLGIPLPSSGPDVPWPLPNVHLGVSAEHQRAADVRLAFLRKCPAAVRWVSYEPALGPVDFNPFLEWLDWGVVGGESGPRSRACFVAWIRQSVQQFKAAGKPIFAKQLGAVVHDRNDANFADVCGAGAHVDEWPEGTVDKIEHNPNGFREEYQGAPIRIRLHKKKGNDMAEWPADLRVREFPR